jgi:predicted RNase H-like HicB family nuclease
MNPLITLWQTFIYGTLKRRPATDLSEMPTQLNFVMHYDKRNKLYWVEATNLPEFVVTGKTLEEVAKNIGDTILVYFDIPTYFAKQYVDGEFKLINPKTGEEETTKLNKEELSRVLA